MMINRFVFCHVNKVTSGWELRHLSYNKVGEKNLIICMKFYREITIREMQKEEKTNDV